ncbi:hypothetical protein BG004_003497 [Podila humilis]|nr:hypothetical protein BG004_003497 [Podila humilis]
MSSSASSTKDNNINNDTHSTADQQQPKAPSSHSEKPILALPAPGDVDANTNQLEVNGKDIKLDALGPVVVNENGTMSRIDNWAEMTEIEKSNVRRILLKRNDLRLKSLRAARDAEMAATTNNNNNSSNNDDDASSVIPVSDEKK